MDKNSTRYPYTYACDFLRMAASCADECKVSRGEASAMRVAIAKVIGIDDAELARKIADYYLAHEEEIDGRFAKSVAAHVFGAAEA